MQGVEFEPVARAICDERDYELVRLVGRGAFKQTFEVARSDGTSLALKVCHPNASRTRTEREVKAMLRCAHPSIARLVAVSVCVWRGAPRLYYLEEFIAGGTLGGLL